MSENLTVAPCWRSLLFIPANNLRVIEKAHIRGADALILDLEDAVPVADKPAARAGLPDVIRQLHAHGASLLVRINLGLDSLANDLEAAVQPGVSAIVVPKVEDADSLRAVADGIAALEQQRGLVAGSVGLLALIESPAALFRLTEICAVPRLRGIALGSEDFSLMLGVPPTAHCLTLPCQMLALAASAAGIKAFGLPESLANFRDLDAYRMSATTARAMGLSGALCIHPAQVTVVNEIFAPSAKDVAWANEVLAAWQIAQEKGVGVVALAGQMIDKPVVERAQGILAQLRPAQETH